MPRWGVPSDPGASQPPPSRLIPRPAGTAFTAALSDTGVTQTDSIARVKAAARSLSDTGVAQYDTWSVRLTATNASGSDTKTRSSYISINVGRVLAAARTLSDTGVTQTDSIARAGVFARTASDTGVTNTDSLARAIAKPRALSDSGLASHTWDVRLTATNSGGSDTKTRTGYITTTDGVVRAFVGGRALSTTGVTASDSIAVAGLNKTRSLSDTGITQTAATWSVRLTATNASGSNTKTRTSYITVSSDVITKGQGTTRTLSDYGLAHTWDSGTWDGDLWDTEISDTLSRAQIEPRALSTTGLTQTDSVGTSYGRALTDRGVTNTESLAKGSAVPRTLSDAGITPVAPGGAAYDSGHYDTGTYDFGLGGASDTIDTSVGVGTTYNRPIADSGTSFSEVLAVSGGNRPRALNDVGYFSGGGELIVRLLDLPRAFSDTGMSQTDVLNRQPYNQTLLVTETGLTFSDSVVATNGTGGLSAVAVVPEDLTEFAVVVEDLTEVGV